MTTFPPDGPADRCASAVNALQLDLIGETIELAASYARSAAETPLLVALVAATKGATSDRLKALKKLWSRATMGATKVPSGRLVSPSLPLEGRDHDQGPAPTIEQTRARDMNTVQPRRARQ